MRSHAEGFGLRPELAPRDTDAAKPGAQRIDRREPGARCGRPEAGRLERVGWWLGCDPRRVHKRRGVQALRGERPLGLQRALRSEQAAAATQRRSVREHTVDLGRSWMPAGCQRFSESLLAGSIEMSRGSRSRESCVVAARLRRRRDVHTGRVWLRSGGEHAVRRGGFRGTGQLRRPRETEFTSGASALGGLPGGALFGGSRERRAAGRTCPLGGGKASGSERIIEQELGLGSVASTGTSVPDGKIGLQGGAGQRRPGCFDSGVRRRWRRLIGTRLAQRLRQQRRAGRRRLRHPGGAAATERQEGNGCGDAVRLLARGILRGV